MQSILMDLAYGVRQVARSPLYFLSAVASLAIGIGAAAAAYAFAGAFFLRTLPVAEPQGWVRLYQGYAHGFRWGEMSYMDFEDYRALDSIFDEMIAESYVPMNVEAEDRSERLWGSLVTGHYFEALELQPSAGRLLQPADASRPGADAVVVISDGYWRRRYGSDPGVVGSVVTLNGRPFAIVGVAPAHFSGTMVGLDPELWAPVTMQANLVPGADWLNSRRRRGLWVLGRLADGVSVEQAAAATGTLARAIEAEYPDDHRGTDGVSLIAEREGSLHPFFRPHFLRFFAVVTAVVALVLSISCANVAGLLLARAVVRASELGVRQALGASPGRIVRQLVTEGAVLALAGGLVGVGLAELGIQALLRMLPAAEVPVAIDVRLDPGVLGFGVGVTFLTTLAFTLVPAIVATRGSALASLRPKGAAGGPSFLRRGLVVSQVAAAACLLATSGLFLKGLQRIHELDLGFRADGVAVASMDVGLQGYAEEEGRAFYRELRSRASGLSGIESVALARIVPFPLDRSGTQVLPEGFEVRTDDDQPVAHFNVVTPGYFETVEMPLLEGRDFLDSDDAEGQRVIIINQTFAARYWHGAALGRRVEIWGDWHVVVGVARDAKYYTAGEDPIPYMYLPLEQRYSSEMTLHARGPAPGLWKQLGQLVAELDAGLPVFDVGPMRERLRTAELPSRIGGTVLGSFGVAALVLTVVGLFGLVDYAARQRRSEFGVRLALGAAPAELVRGLLSHTLRLAALGTMLGLAGAAGLGSLAAAVLPGVSAVDAVSFSIAGALVVTSALAAGLGPALRTGSLDPATALRHE